MVSFRCYDYSNVIATWLIITNFHLCLIQFRRQFVQIFVNCNVANAQTWEVLTLKNPKWVALPPSSTSPVYKTI